MFFNQTYMFYRIFAELSESGKKFEKSSHGRKLSEKCHEKVNALQAKRFLILKTRLISQSGNYLKPLELNFQIRLSVGSNRANKQLMSVEQQAMSLALRVQCTRFEQIQHI